MTDMLDGLRSRDFSFEPMYPKPPLPAPIKTEDDMARWRGELAEANAEVEQWGRERSRVLAHATVEEIQRLDASAVTARVRADRASAVIEQGEARFAELAERHRAAQPERRRKHKAALAARDEAERIIREEYAPAAELIAGMMRKLRELEEIIGNAGEPPDGEEHVPHYEKFRHPPENYYWQMGSLTSEVDLPPVVRNQPAFWPPGR